MSTFRPSVTPLSRKSSQYFSPFLKRAISAVCFGCQCGDSEWERHIFRRLLRVPTVHTNSVGDRSFVGCTLYSTAYPRHTHTRSRLAALQGYQEKFLCVDDHTFNDRGGEKIEISTHSIVKSNCFPVSLISCSANMAQSPYRSQTSAIILWCTTFKNRLCFWLGPIAAK